MVHIHQAPCTVTLVTALGPRFLDAHEIAERDFDVVTRPHQSDATQLWRLRSPARSASAIPGSSGGSSTQSP